MSRTMNQVHLGLDASNIILRRRTAIYTLLTMTLRRRVLRRLRRLRLTLHYGSPLSMNARTTLRTRLRLNSLHLQRIRMRILNTLITIVINVKGNLFRRLGLSLSIRFSFFLSTELTPSKRLRTTPTGTKLHSRETFFARRPLLRQTTHPK